MSSTAVVSRASARADRPSINLVALIMGVVAVAVPTLIENLHQSWASEQGQAGPLVLAIGLWLAVRRWPAMRAAGSPGVPWVAISLGLLFGGAYVLGRLADQFLIESYALYGLAVAGLYTMVGKRGLKVGWFPLAYLLFALPVPYTASWQLTSHLRLWITECAVGFFQQMNFAIAQDGLDILIDQYRLAVKEACSGMNSLVSLSAIGFVYLYIRRSPPWWYLAAWAIPIVGFAILGNFTRVLILILLTHYFGDAVAQSFLHEGAGLAVFLVALVGVIGIDAIVAGRVLNFVPSRART